MFKINWNVFDKLDKKVGVGVIAEDVEGFISAIMCTTMPFIIDPTVGDAVTA
jgi:hypothetical protein